MTEPLDSHELCLTHVAAVEGVVQKIRKFPISALTQLFATAACIKHKSRECGESLLAWPSQDVFL